MDSSARWIQIEERARANCGHHGHRDCAEGGRDKARDADRAMQGLTTIPMTKEGKVGQQMLNHVFKITRTTHPLFRGRLLRESTSLTTLEMSLGNSGLGH